jgi:hypothetical protein
MKQVRPLLDKSSDLDGQLVMANIIKENETASLVESNSAVIYNDEERAAANNETLQFMDEVISFIEKLTNNINEM